MWLDSIAISDRVLIFALSIIFLAFNEPYFYVPLRWLNHIKWIFHNSADFKIVCVLVIHTSALFICYLVDNLVYFSIWAYENPRHGPDHRVIFFKYTNYLIYFEVNFSSFRKYKPSPRGYFCTWSDALVYSMELKK